VFLDKSDFVLPGGNETAEAAPVELRFARRSDGIS
jgi:hypothetical protein